MLPLTQKNNKQDLIEKDRAKSIDIAKKMLLLGGNIMRISMITGLKEEEIKSISIG